MADSSSSASAAVLANQLGGQSLQKVLYLCHLGLRVADAIQDEGIGK